MPLQGVLSAGHDAEPNLDLAPLIIHLLLNRLFGTERYRRSPSLTGRAASQPPATGCHWAPVAEQ